MQSRHVIFNAVLAISLAAESSAGFGASDVAACIGDKHAKLVVVGGRTRIILRYDLLEEFRFLMIHTLVAAVLIISLQAVSSETVVRSAILTT